MQGILHASTRAFGVEPKAEPTDFGFLLACFGIMLAVILSIVGGYFCWMAIAKQRQSRLDWKRAESLLRERGLTREESGLLRTYLKKYGYASPTRVLRIRSEYEKFLGRIQKTRDTRAASVLQAMFHKIFTDR